MVSPPADSRVARKLAILADAAKYDASCASSGAKRRGNGVGLGNATGSGICHSYTPDGRCVSLLKVLLTNFCIYDCRYCINRASSDTPRARFTPEEVVDLTLEFYRRNYIEGLFLSSGIIVSPDYTMEQVIRVARTLRETHFFNGYIHLKTAAGAADELVREAAKWADRLSVNVELPTRSDLETLAPEKKPEAITRSMSVIRDRIQESREAARPAARRSEVSVVGPRDGRGRWTRTAVGQSTQMIVGATPTSDATVLSAAHRLYRGYGLRRVYYSAFSPIPDGDIRLPLLAPPLMREHRLYQADWLMRFYGFRTDELTTPADPNLSLDIDPKLAWALRHRELFPLDLNAADRAMLLRVPGLGVRTVDKLILARRHRQLRTADLRTLGVSLRKVQPFVITADARPGLGETDSALLRTRLAPRYQQLALFEAAPQALTGEF